MNAYVQVLFYFLKFTWWQSSFLDIQLQSGSNEHFHSTLDSVAIKTDLLANVTSVSYKVSYNKIYSGAVIAQKFWRPGPQPIATRNPSGKSIKGNWGGG
jgi:hypothetical protein